MDRVCYIDTYLCLRTCVRGIRCRGNLQRAGMRLVLIRVRTLYRSSVRISDDCSTVVVGAFGSDTCGVFSGAAYVYLADELGSRNPHLMNWHRGGNPRKQEGRMVCRRVL